MCFIVRNNCPQSTSTVPVLEIIQKATYDVPLAEPISVARILLYQMGSMEYRYETQILFTTFNSETIHTAKEFLDICSIISEKAEYKFCLGLNMDHYYEYFFAIIRYHVESCHVWEHPFKRIDSKNCLLWHKLQKMPLWKIMTKVQFCAEDASECILIWNTREGGLMSVQREVPKDSCHHHILS